MKKKSLCFLTVLSVFLLWGSISMANDSILESLINKGVTVEVMDDASLSEVRGAELIYGQPYPSVVWGKKTHHVTYSGFGSFSDYTSYNYIGSGYNPGLYYTYYNGYWWYAGGDEWWADKTSDPNEWNSAYAELIEYHYQILNEDYTPSAYALRETEWNRPISTFSW